MPRSKLERRGPVVINGTSTGIGAATAVYLADQGFRVFAGIRRPTPSDRGGVAHSSRPN